MANFYQTARTKLPVYLYFYQNSAAMNMNRMYLLLLATTLLCTRAGAQFYNPDIDVLHYGFTLEVNDADNNILGTADILVTFRKEARSFALDLVKKNSTGKGMTVSSITENGRPIHFTQDSDQVILQTAGRSGSQHTYSIRYEGIPADGLIIANNKFGHRGFFGDNWPNRAHNWLPCVDNPSDKATVDFTVTAPDHYQVVANGALQEEKTLPGQKKLTRWKESAPLAPKVMVVGIADFAIDHPGDAMGIPVWNYVYPENKEKGFHDYAFALQILPFYISHIGPYPFEKCGNVQSKTRFGGLENASAIFYFENSVGSPGVESLMAHEIAHQWFGDAATETQWPHLWLSEGFATYMTHCYLENKYGADTLKTGMKKDREKLIAFEKRRKTPIVDTSITKDFMQLLNPNSYEKGGWVLHMLRRRIGDKLFWKGISTYYATYRNKNASSSDFEAVMEKVSGQDLHAFFHQWLFTSGHPNLTIQEQYDTDAKQLTVTFTQTQDALFEFPLEYTVDGSPYNIQIKNKTTTIRLPLAVKPEKLIPDPNTNVLATFQVSPL
jgi:aminopeptidase N